MASDVIRVNIPMVRFGEFVRALSGASLDGPGDLHAGEGLAIIQDGRVVGNFLCSSRVNDGAAGVVRLELKALDDGAMGVIRWLLETSPGLN